MSKQQIEWKIIWLIVFQTNFDFFCFIISSVFLFYRQVISKKMQSCWLKWRELKWMPSKLSGTQSRWVTRVATVSRWPWGSDLSCPGRSSTRARWGTCWSWGGGHLLLTSSLNFGQFMTYPPQCHSLYLFSISLT